MKRLWLPILLVGCASQPAPTPSAPSPDPAEAAASAAATPGSFDITVNDDVYTIARGDRSAQVRYSEEREADGSFNYPRLVAKLELKTEAGWVEVIHVHCHDSYDDCGTIQDDLSCPVVEESWISEGLFKLHEALNEPPEVGLLDALGQQTPIAPCMARFNQSYPGAIYDGAAIDIADDHLRDSIGDRVTAAEDLWSDDQLGAIEELVEVDGMLETLAPATRFKIEYQLARVRATAADQYQTPIVGKGGIVQADATLLAHLDWDLQEGRRAWAESGGIGPFPDVPLEQATKLDLDKLPTVAKPVVAQEAKKGAVLKQAYLLNPGGAIYLYFVLPSATGGDADDLDLFLRSDGREYTRYEMSSTDDDKWARPPL